MRSPASNPDHFGGANVRGKRRTITLRAGYTDTMTLQLLQENGNPWDLAALGFSESESEPAESLAIVARVVEHGTTTTATPPTPCEITDFHNAEVTLPVPGQVQATAGIWLVDFALQRDENDFFLLDDCYLLVERGPTTQGAGLPSVAEVRLFLRDYAQENELLDAVDFDASEIAFAASSCVDEWNAIDPFDGPQYTTQNFPHRWFWLVGIVSRLFLIAAEHYFRNQLAYSTGGGSTLDDKNKGVIYQQRASAAKKEWQEFAASRKTVEAAQGAWGIIPGVFADNYTW